MRKKQAKKQAANKIQLISEVKMTGQIIISVGDAVAVVRQNNRLFFECTRCSNDYGDISIGDPKKNAIMRERSIGEVNPWNKYGKADQFVVREYYCPKCGIMISANMQKKDEPLMMDMELSKS